MFRVIYKEGPIETIYFIEALSSRSAKRAICEHVGIFDPHGRYRFEYELRLRKASMSAIPHVEPVKLYSFNTQTGEIT